MKTPLKTMFNFLTFKDILIVFAVLLITLLFYMFVKIQNFPHLNDIHEKTILKVTNRPLILVLRFLF
jgi:hypothetical protein